MKEKKRSGCTLLLREREREREDRRTGRWWWLLAVSHLCYPVNIILGPHFRIPATDINSQHSYKEPTPTISTLVLERERDLPRKSILSFLLKSFLLRTNGVVTDGYTFHAIREWEEEMDVKGKKLKSAFHEIVNFFIQCTFKPITTWKGNFGLFAHFYM